MKWAQRRQPTWSRSPSEIGCPICRCSLPRGCTSRCRWNPATRAFGPRFRMCYGGWLKRAFGSRARMGQDDLFREEAVSPPMTTRATWVRYQVLAAGCLLAVLTYIQRLGFSNALPDIKQSLGLNDEHTGYLS